MQSIEPDVTYYAYVRAKCDASHYSDWSGPRSFGSVFAAPHDFYSTDVTANTATVTWTNGDDETSWQIVTSTTPDFNPDNAQSLTVGEGGTRGDVPVPLAYANLGNTKSEFIIPAERLTAMKYGTINRLTFYCDAQTWMGAGIWVYVGETDQTSLNADNLIPANDMTYVHYGKMIVADQQMVVTFNSSTHQYMGGNLVVYFEQYNAGEASTGRWYGVAADNQAMYYDGTTWTTVGVSQNDLIQGNYRLQGLSASSNYQIRVRAACSANDFSDWTTAIAAQTLCGLYTDEAYLENFDEIVSEQWQDEEHNLPLCWQWINASMHESNKLFPTVFTVNQYDSQYQSPYSLLKFQVNGDVNNYGEETAYDQYAILPEIADLETKQMKFSARAGEWGTPVEFEVGLITDPTDASTYQFIQSIHPNDANYTKYTIPFNTYTGNGNYIVFRMVGNPSMRSRAYIDDIVVSEIVNYTNVFTCESYDGGYWNDPSYWSAGTLPTMDDNVTIKGKAIIPSDYVAEANIVEFGENGSLHVENNGQLKHNNIGVQATFAKAIEGYGESVRGGYYLISSPMVGSLDAKTNQYFGTGDVLGLLDSEYDLYRFSQSYDEEWRNYKKDLFTIDMKTGYLYANRDGVTLTYSGTLQPSGNEVEVTLENESTATFDGYNLIGNPFPCDAYLADGRSFYRINREGTNLMEADGSIAPCEGIFVQSTAPGQSVAFTRNQPRSEGSMAFTVSKKEQARGGVSAVADRARIRFGEGNNLGKLTLMASPDRLYIPQNGTDYAVVFSQPVGELPINFEASENGTYTLSFENATEGLVYCHLIDNMTGEDVDLLAGASTGSATYTFTAKKSDYASRFRVVFASVCGDANGDSETFAFNHDGQWIILNDGRATLQVIDIAGRILASEQI